MLARSALSGKRVACAWYEGPRLKQVRFGAAPCLSERVRLVRSGGDIFRASPRLDLFIIGRLPRKVTGLLHSQRQPRRL